MEDIFSTKTLEAMIEAERAKEKRKMPSLDEISNSLHQIGLERMTLNGSPSSDVLRRLLSQHDITDMQHVLAVVRFVLKTAVGSPKWYVYRFKKLVNAVRYIRHVWLASRFRFAVKLQSIVAKWTMEEENARKERNRESMSQKRERAAQSNAHFDYLSIGAPLELKKKVLLTHYRNLQKEYLARWNRWWKIKKDYDTFLKDIAMMHPAKKERMMAEREPPPPEPEFKWFPVLNGLTHEQLFELSLKMQQSMTAKDIKKKRGQAGGGGADSSLGGAENSLAAQEYAARHEIEDDNWVEKSLQSIGIESRSDRMIRQQMLEANNSQVDEQHSRKKYDHITSRLFESYEKVGGTGGAEESGGVGAKQSGASGGVGAGPDPHKTKRTGYNLEERFSELKGMPVLSKFKTQGWHLPPRPLPHHLSRPKATIQKKCDPPSYQTLNPMEQSLCTRGVFTQPDMGHSMEKARREEAAKRRDPLEHSRRIREKKKKEKERKKDQEEQRRQHQQQQRSTPTPTPADDDPLSGTGTKRQVTMLLDSRRASSTSSSIQSHTQRSAGTRSQSSLQQLNNKSQTNYDPKCSKKLMGQVKEELKRLPSTYCGVRDILRSHRAIEITLGIAPDDLKISANKSKSLYSDLAVRKRPQSALR